MWCCQLPKLSSVFTQRGSERHRNGEQKCVYVCVSVKVPCVSFALLSTAPVSHKSSSVSQLSFLLFLVCFSMASLCFALCCFGLTFIPPYVFSSFSCELNAAGQVTVYQPVQRSLLLRKTQAVSADIKVYRVSYRPCTLLDPELQIPASNFSTITFSVK